MNRYRYKAINNSGRYINGTMSADSPSELSSMLKTTGLEIISFKIDKPLFSSFSGKIKPKDLIATFIHLEQLDKAGVPIIDSISDLKETSDSPAVRSLMYEVYESIKNGKLFSESLAKHSKIFNSVYIGLIASGEKTGKLADAFNNIIEDLKWNIEFKRKVNKATIGPMFGIFLMFIVTAIMMSVVVPKVTGFLSTQEIAMPASTKALIGVSDFFQNNWLIIILFFPVLYAILKVLGRFPEIGVRLDDLKLKIPVIGPVATKLDAAKFCQFFAMTFKSGLGVIECLDSASMVIKNSAIRRSILSVKQDVSDGRALAESIASTGYFPPLVSRMFKVGEESGNMQESLQNIKYFYDSEINDAIDRLVGMIQPTLTIVMGGMIAWITIAVFGPIYSTFSKIR